MAGYDRQIIDGTPGTVWVNDTGKPRYQFLCSLVHTCGACLQYHLKIGPFWPIPIHPQCRCRQAVIAVGAEAPHPFCDFKALLDAMPLDQQKAAVGASNWRLLQSGVVQWKDVVTPARVRDFREVVALKKLSVKALVDAGVQPVFAEAAHAAVHAPAHQLVAAQRAQQVASLNAAGFSQDQLARELARRLGARVSLQSVPTLAGATTVSGLSGAGGSTAAQLKKLLILPTIAAMGPKPKPKKKPPDDGAPPAATGPAPGPKPKPGGFPADPDALKVVKKLGGSTGAELVEDEDGALYVRKRGANAGHLAEEGHADDLYRAMGVDVPKSKLYATPGGPVKLAEFAHGKSLAELEHSDPAAYAAAVAKLKKGFVADALLGNWDVVGMGMDNILVTADGRVLRIDNGGSLRYRAQGALKPASQWSGAVGELDSLRNPGINPSAAKVFGGVADAEVRAQARALVSKRSAILAAAPPELRDVLKARLDHLKTIAEAKPAPAAIKGWKPTPAAEFRTFATTVEADKYAAGHYKDWARSLTTAERAVVQDYKDTDYIEINKYYRAPKTYKGSMPVAEIERKAAELDRALARHPTPEALTTVRYFDLASVGLTSGKVAIGDPITDRGFTSTSVNPHHKWPGQRFEVRVPAGTPAGYVKVATSSHESEYELLLGRGADTFRVVEVRADAARTIVVELVPKKAGKR